jgi:uncharacterized membrane protein YgaE (UPF0421/DUF939 family)
MGAATLVGGGPLLASQAGASAVLVATLQPPDGGVDFGRAVDALVGSGSALLVSSLLLPLNPRRLLRESAGPVLDELVEALERLSEALSARRLEATEAALETLARADGVHDALVAALEPAGEAIQLSPQRRRALGDLDRYAVAAVPVGRLIEDIRSLARGARRAISVDDSVPPEAVQAIDELTAATRGLNRYLDDGDPEPTSAAATRAAALANAVLEATGNLSAVHIVGQIRLAAVDLLRATGLPRPEAQEAVRGARLS